MSNVWFITGAGRGLGIDIAQSALAASHQVVATGRDPKKVLEAIGEHENLLTVALDITDQEAADAAAQTAVETIWPELDVEDYAELTAQTIETWKGMNGRQGGDPKKLGRALVSLSDSDGLPLRFLAGADVMAGEEENLATVQGQIDAHRELSASLSFDA